MRSPGQITEHKTALAALAAERGTSLHSRRELERLQVQMHTDRAGREALLERFRRSNEEAGREMDIHRQKAEELRTQCGQLKEQLASLAGGEAGAGAPPHPAESGDAALQ